ncbi:Zinc finger, CCHC domain-containing protein [Varicellaria rhodocarpa]|nr:Zinc finger, CCHC domain-containing protein [Varicellaria rhodocarpa]
MSALPTFGVQHHSPSEPLRPTIDFPSLSEAKKAPKGRRRFAKKPRADPMPVQELESHLRGMIIHNGIPEGSNTTALHNPVPPHLRSAPAAEQEAYLKRHGEERPGPVLNVSSPNQAKTIQQAFSSQQSLAHKEPQIVQAAISQHDSNAPLPRKKLTQAEKKKKYRAQQSLTILSASATADCTVEATEVVPKISQVSSGSTQQHPKQPSHSNRVSKQPLVSDSSTHALVGNVVQANPSSQQEIRGHSRPEHGNGARHPHTQGVPYPQHELKPHQQHVTRPHAQVAPHPQHEPKPHQQHAPHRHIQGGPSHQYDYKPHQQHVTYRHAQGGPSQDLSRQLYDPTNNRMQGNNYQRGFNSRHRFECAPLVEQVEFLNRLATVEVPLAEISNEDLNATERLRKILEDVCRSTISTFEEAKGPEFVPDTVALKCFGSLSSGFATRSSDMDLALISPTSRPDPASPDSEIPRLLEKALLDMGYGARLLTRTRVPIIKFCENPSPELAEALMQARHEWEMTKDLTPLPQRADKVDSVDRTAKGKSISDQTQEGEALDSSKEKVSDVEVVIEAKVYSQSININGHTENEGNSIRGNHGTKTHETSHQIHDPLSNLCSGAAPGPLQTIVNDANENTSAEENEDGKGDRKIEPIRAILELDHDHKTSMVEDGRAQATVDNQMIHDKSLVKTPSNDSPPRSDEELVRLYMLAITEDWFDDKERKIIFRFTTAVKKYKIDTNEQSCLELTDARAALKSLPDVLKRYREKHEDPLNFPKTGVGIQCDINFSNQLAVHNTHLLRCYAHCDPRIRPMVLFVKTWAKRRKINSPYHGTLSSYGYVLMVLHFVINIADPPLAPNLQLSRRPPPRGSDPKISDSICEGCDVRFWRSEREIKDCVRKGTLMPDRNRESIGSLLRNFFNYFAHTGPHGLGGGFVWTQEVLSLRTPGGRMFKPDKGWTGAKTVTVEAKQPGQENTEIRHRYLFCIEDPFETDHNIARTVVHHGIVAIRDEFRRAHRIILHAGLDGGVPTYLFEEAKDPPLQRSFFGPKPRPEFGPENLAEHLRPSASTEAESSRALKSKDSQEFTGCLSPVSQAPSDFEDEPVPAMTLNG